MRVPAVLVASAAFLAAACGPSLVLAGPVEQASRVDPPRTVEAGEKPAVFVDSPAGAVSLRAAEGTAVVVEATRRAPTEADLDRIRVVVEKGADGAVKVGWTADGDRKGLSVSFSIAAPAASGLRVKSGAGALEAEGFANGLTASTGAGKVSAKGVKGDLVLESEAGAVEVRDGRGSVAAKSGAGAVEVRDTEGALRLESSAGAVEVGGGGGSVEARTGAGRVSVRGRHGDLVLESSAGSVEVEGAKGRVRAETGSGSVRIEGDLSGDCLARTDAGSVEIRLPAKASLAVEGKTDAGSVETDFELSVEGGGGSRSVRGKLGDGKGGTLRVETGAGKIEIRGR